MLTHTHTHTHTHRGMIPKHNKRRLQLRLNEEPPVYIKILAKELKERRTIKVDQNSKQKDRMGFFSSSRN